MGVVVFVVGGDPPQVLAAGIAGVVIAYTIAAELDGRELLAAAGLLAAAVVLRDIADPALNGFDIAIDMLWFVGAFAVGRVVRRRQKHVELVSIVAADLQEDAVRRERERIARELHDVIAHGMSVMVVQADAARHGLSPGDDATRTALEQIERTGRESLREMRRLLGLLRDDDAAGGRRSSRSRASPESMRSSRRSDRQACLSNSALSARRCRSRRGSTWLHTGSCRRRSRMRSGTPAPRAPRSRSPTARTPFR